MAADVRNKEKLSDGRIDVRNQSEVDRVRRQRRRRARRGAHRPFTSVAIIAALFAAGFPFIWRASSSFKRDPDLYTPGNNPFIYNLPPTTESIGLPVPIDQFLTFAWNTLWSAGWSWRDHALVGPARGLQPRPAPLRWGGPLGIAIFLVYLVPPSLLFISLSRVVANLGLQNSRGRWC